MHLSHLATALVFLMIGLACPYFKVYIENLAKALQDVRDRADAWDALIEHSAYSGKPVHKLVSQVIEAHQVQTADAAYATTITD